MSNVRLAAVTAVVCGLVVAAIPASPVSASNGNADGFLYGTITTRSGSTYSGILRWGTEEAFWDDLFHSSKEDLPYARYHAEDDDDDADRWWRVFGRRIRVRWGEDNVSRVFIARFGDIREIRVVGSDDAEVTMKSGTTFMVSGYANDVGGKVHVQDEALGGIEVPWKKIDTIEFKAVPANAKPEGYRLRGKVLTESGEFEGFIQWDKQECLSFDELDGDSEDGRLSIAMGKIRSIERRSRRSSRVVLNDGRELVLDGTNDVDSSNRGILVEDARFGRVEVPWDEFERVDFSRPGGSGLAYGDYPAAKPLSGTVTTRAGKKLTGKIIYDLDESEGWEMLNGSSFDLEYIIPFSRVASIVPRGHSGVEVALRNGEELRLEDGQDVSDRNDGVVVVARGSDEVFVHWDEVRRIDFD